MFEEPLKKVIESDLVVNQSLLVNKAIEKAIRAGIPYTSEDSQNISQALKTLQLAKKDNRWADSFRPLAEATLELEKNF